MLAAKATLLVAGISLFTVGIAQADPQPVPTITISTFTKAQFPTQFEVFSNVADAWRELGIDVKVLPLNYPTPFKTVVDDTRDFDIFGIGYDSNTLRIDPQANLDLMFYGPNADIAGSANVSGYSNPEYDKLVEAERVEYDPVARRELVFKMQEVLYEERPALIMLHKYDQNAYNSARFANPVLGPGFFMDPRAEMTIEPQTDDGVLRRGMQTKTMGSLNIFNPSPEQWQLRLIYDTLLRTSPSGEPENWMVTNIDVKSPTSIEVTLRDDLKWHDGKDLTAEDVAFTFNYLKEHPAPRYSVHLGGFDKAEVSGDGKVLFTLERPNSSFVTQTMVFVPIIPKHIWEDVTEPENAPNDVVIASGPFKFDYVREGQESKMSAFKEHFFPPKVEGLLYIYYGSQEAMYNGLINQDVDVIESLLPHQVEELESYDYLTVLAGPSLNITGLYFNLRRGAPFDDLAFRKALAHAIPMERIKEDIYLGLVTPGASPISPVNEYWFNPDITPLPYEPEVARQILTDAGYSWNNDGKLMLPE
jgi:peptide/nickel transport system substrate-binding protein